MDLVGITKQTLRRLSGAQTEHWSRGRRFTFLNDRLGSRPALRAILLIVATITSNPYYQRQHSEKRRKDEARHRTQILAFMSPVHAMQATVGGLRGDSRQILIVGVSFFDFQTNGCVRDGQAETKATKAGANG
jgi:hypothetical protein